MSMFGKHIWAFELLACCLLLGGFSPAAAETSAAAQAADARAGRLVRQYGQARGGAETIGDLVELNMRQWKPQSNRGIAVLGWRVEKMGEHMYRVVYEYQEMGREPVELPWRVDLTTSEIVPLTPLSARIQQMSLLL